ncbi:MAG: ABC transporter permease [Bacteroidetes bacterium]|nr:ABC transporter permease [Bacteroidota bacterium]
MMSGFRRRRLTTFITVAGIALVVFVFTAVLMMSNGVEETLSSGGSERNAVIARRSSQGEISSIIDGNTIHVIKTLPQIATDSKGTPLISAEPVVVINLDKVGGGLSNVTVRGVDQTAFELRPHVKMVEGRTFDPGSREVVVGVALTKSFYGVSIGEKIKFANDYWTIVGIMDGKGSAFESEVWGDATQLQAAFNRANTVSTMTVRMKDGVRIEDFKKAFDEDKRLNQFEPKSEIKFYKEQSEALAIFINVLGIVITIIFSFGAVIGAVITMYTAVANRTTEIGTLRALGFRRRSVLWSFMLEAILISGVGGMLGVLLASFLEFFSISTMNFNSFSELAFSFALSPGIVIGSLIFAVFMGILGGFFPSIRAARLKIVDSLRNE